MKRLFLLSIIALFFVSAFAQLNGTGYYRVQNYGSKRYIYVCDATSSGINAGAGTADMGAVQTWTDLNKAITDPASIIYIQQQGSQWDLLAQNTGVHQMINYYVGITELSHDLNIYQVSATAAGQTMYLCDAETSDVDMGALGTGNGGGTYASYSRWQVFGLNQTDNYIAVKPNITVNGKHYAPYFASYPFSFYSSGMKAYYVKKIDYPSKLAVIAEVNGVIPSNTPVFIECSSSEVSQNKLQLNDYFAYPNSPADNVLKGVYFANKYRSSSVSRTEYDSNTMRVLGVTSSGKLGFVTATNDMLTNCGKKNSPKWCLPANQSYLPVNSGSASEFTIITQEEYESLYSTPITNISLDKSTASIQVGENITLNTTYAPSNASNTDFEWTTSNASVATVANGVVKGIAEGTAVITVKTTDGSNLSASCTVTVTPAKVTSIVLSQSNAEVYVGESFQLTATVLPEYAANKTVTWSSNDLNVATVDQNGNVTPKAAGWAGIIATANDGSGISAKCVVKVNAVIAQSMSLDQTSISAIVGDQVQINATFSPANTSNKNLSWKSSNESVCTVSNGLVTMTGKGDAVITATTVDGSNLSATCQVSVAPAKVTQIVFNKSNLEMNVGDQYQLIATVLPEVAENKTVTWTSNDTRVATVDDNGLITAIAEGWAGIIATATDGSGVSSKCVVKVNVVKAESISLNQTNVSSHIGEQVQLTATILPENTTNKNVEWSSSNESVATVENGLVTMHALGNATITVNTLDGSNLNATCQVNVAAVTVSQINLNMTNLELFEGESFHLVATVLPDNAQNKTVTWSTDAPEIATVDQDGNVTAIKAGRASVVATANDGSGVSQKCTVLVKGILATSITLDQTKVNAYAGDMIQLTATVLPENVSNKEITWSSDNEEVATVVDGLVSVLSVGKATITATTADGSNLSASCEVECLPIFATGITLNESEITLAYAEEKQLLAEILPENASNKSVVWATSDANVATVSETGVVTGVEVGTAVITVTTADGTDLSATCNVTCFSGSGIGSVLVADYPAGTSFYTVSGQKIPSPRRGLIIVKYADGRFEKVMVK